MIAHPTIVLNDAVQAARPDLMRAGTAMADALVEQLTSEPYYAQFEFVVTGRIIDPATGTEIGLIEHKLPYAIFEDRNPDARDRTE